MVLCAEVQTQLVSDLPGRDMNMMQHWGREKPQMMLQMAFAICECGANSRPVEHFW